MTTLNKIKIIYKTLLNNNCDANSIENIILTLLENLLYDFDIIDKKGYEKIFEIFTYKRFDKLLTDEEKRYFELHHKSGLVGSECDEYENLQKILITI